MQTTLPILERNPKNLDDVNDACEAPIYEAIRYMLHADRSSHISFKRRQV